MIRSLLCAAIVFATGCAASAPAQPGTQPGAQAPPTPKRPVTDEYHGVKVTDDYRWLEDWSSPEVKAWSDAQNAHARAVLDSLPSVDAIRARVTKLRSSAAPDYGSLAWEGGRLFAVKFQPPKEQPILVWMPSADDPGSERTILDLNERDPSGSTSMDFYVPSLDGRKIAVALSSGGSESGDVHVFDVDTGKEIAEVVPRVNGGTAGGSVAWNGDGSGFYYTRYPRPGERPDEDLFFYQQVYFHKLGTPTESDTYEVGKEFPRIAEIELETSEDGRLVAARVSDGDGGEYRHLVRTPDGQWRRTTSFEDRSTVSHFGPPDLFCMINFKGAPRGKLMTVPTFDPDIANGEVPIPEGLSVMEDFAKTPEHYWVRYQAGGMSELQLFDFRGAPSGYIPVLPVSTVGQLVKAGGEHVLFRNESYTVPPAWYAVEAGGVEPRKTALAKESAVSFEDCEVVREHAVSKDGTRVPITIVRPKGAALDGNHPTLLYGYGGYGASTMPSFSEVRKLWLEQGGVLAFANIRGGGEFGDAWHLGGNLTKKQNVFDDFHACMKRMVELGYCTPAKLAIMGGSNGGLLMGAMITQHPGDFRAAVSSVGIYDMLRVELSPNGEFNVTEFGTVKNPEHFRAMHAYSPYHRVQDGAAYPSVLFMTGANDPRVDPMQSRKMTARLQAATSSGNPVLLRTSANAGHGIGSSLSQRIEQDVDRYAFLFAALGVEYKPVE